MTLLLMALSLKNKDLVTVLIENGADVNTPSVDVRKSSIQLQRSPPCHRSVVECLP